MNNMLDTKNQPEDKLHNMRHSCEHVLHQAMAELFPGLKRAMGPATDEGFYHDFDYSGKVSEADFPRIEKRMKEIIKADMPIIRQELSVEAARKLFKDNLYKQDWLDQIKSRGEKVTVYWTGEPEKKGSDVDLCRGPHVESTGKIGPFKLLSIAGAYWHGDEKNKMLTRIYGTCFSDQKELDKYLWQIEEAKKRDHRVLGKELKLFVIDDDIGKGLPLLTPKGAIIRKQIQDFEYELEKKNGFQHVVTPHIARSEIYKKTGHWQHYRDVMYESFGIEGEEYVLKPMNCPHHYKIYSSEPRSYRDLPIRLTEAGTCYRYEKAGELSGLTRVRALTIDDSHILMTESQIEDEFKRCIKMVEQMFKVFNLNEYYVRLSLSNPSDAIKYIADSDTWDRAKKILEKIVIDNKLKYKVAEGEASFYGPKLDYMVKDSLGRQWQMSTLQLDLFMGKRLGLEYTDKDGSKKHPVILHRGLTGSLERTLAVLIEHFNGAFPLWLSPLQVLIIPIAERHIDYAGKLLEKLHREDVRAEMNSENESLQKKIRMGQLQKANLMVILGDKEVDSNSVSVRKRSGEITNGMSIDKFISYIKEKIKEKSNE